MRAAVYHSLDDVRLEEVPKPKISADEVLVEMRACGVCGSDLMEWYLEKRAPLVLGHEPAGVIVEVGNKVEGFRVGDRVFAHHHVACLTCYYCRHDAFTMCEKFGKTHLELGGFAEFFRVPADNLRIDTLKIPGGVSFEEATLIEPVACGVRAMKKCEIECDSCVVVVGAGPAGIINVALARLFGAGVVVVADVVDYRLRAAERFGADVAVNVERESFVKRVKAVTEDRCADVVVVTAPNVKAYESALDVCRRGGTICVFAPTSPEKVLSVSPHKLFFNEIRLVPSYSTSHLETRVALELIQSKRIDAKGLISHRFPLSQVGEAFRTAARSKECLKVVVYNE
ncbi:MAG: alcohol dehydrogenase catalytic domain-containing protein [Candidatus Bathyarchaeales archaeon]